MTNVPPRSILLRPEPKGKGTAQIESLRSYLYGLSRLHCVTLIQLLWICVEAIRREDRAKKLAHNWMRKTNLLIEAFSTLTMRDDIAHTTFYCWRNCIGSTGFLHHGQKWCPLCLKEDPYERLIWTLLVVKSCPVHKVRLLDRCPTCQSVGVDRMTSPVWAICPRCKQDHALDLTSASTPDQDWVANQISGLIVKGQESPVVKKFRIRQIWKDVVFPPFPSKAEASRTLGLSLPLFEQALRGEYRANINVLLAICRGLQVSLTDVLTGDLKSLRPIPKKCPPISLRTIYSLAEVRRRLSDLLRTNAETCSLRQISRDIGISVHRLTRRFPELASELVSHFRYQRKIANQAKRRIRIRQMVKVIQEQGPGVSGRALVRAIGLPCYASYSELIAEARVEASQLELPLDAYLPVKEKDVRQPVKAKGVQGGQVLL